MIDFHYISLFVFIEYEDNKIVKAIFQCFSCAAYSYEQTFTPAPPGKYISYPSPVNEIHKKEGNFNKVVLGSFFLTELPLV